jgi:hypothetical protein
MLTKVEGYEVTQECANCKKINVMNVSDIEIDFDKELGEYRNFSFICECDAIEIFNMNLPLEEEEETNEARELTKDLMRLIRKDLKNVQR